MRGKHSCGGILNNILVTSHETTSFPIVFQKNKMDFRKSQLILPKAASKF